jgi:hypothetical protein
MTAIRIGTWNVEYAAGPERNARRLAQLIAADADVWVLTETHDDLRLPETYTAVSTDPRPTGRAGGRWTTIWSRWPVVRVIKVDDPVRTVAVLLRGPSGDVAVYGTVLPWHSDPGPGDVPAKAWTEQDRVLPLQLAEWRRIRADFPDAKLVVAGDLNMNLGGKHYYGTKRGRARLREGLTEIDLVCATETSDKLRHPPIDHVLVPAAWSPRARVAAAWEGTGEDRVKLSDHSGLVVEIDGDA